MVSMIDFEREIGRLGLKKIPKDGLDVSGDSSSVIDFRAKRRELFDLRSRNNEGKNPSKNHSLIDLTARRKGATNDTEDETRAGLAVNFVDGIRQVLSEEIDPRMVEDGFEGKREEEFLRRYESISGYMGNPRVNGEDRQALRGILFERAGKLRIFLDGDGGSSFARMHAFTEIQLIIHCFLSDPNDVQSMPALEKIIFGDENFD
jgi:hypothetical protein